MWKYFFTFFEALRGGLILPGFSAIIVVVMFGINSLLLSVCEKPAGRLSVWAAASSCLDVFAVISSKVAYLIYIYNIHRTCARACKWLAVAGSVVIVLKLRKKQKSRGGGGRSGSSGPLGKYGGYASAFARYGCAVCGPAPLLFVICKRRDAGVAGFVLALYYFSNSRGHLVAVLVYDLHKIA